MSTQHIFRLNGKLQHYQWGGFEYIPRLLGISNEAHQPFAEYWLGAHDNAPAGLQDGEGLNKFLEKNTAFLGEKTHRQFGRLPYLLKVLDVKDILSIQVHPTKKAAERDFARENQMGIPLTAPNRNYKDDNHKPELAMALSEFWLLHGFQAAEALIATVSSVPEFDFMLQVFGKGDYKALYELVMTMDQQRVNTILQPVLDRIIPQYQKNALHKTDPAFWAARAALTFNEPGRIDRGIFSIYLFNIMHLRPGQAVFQDAGLLHAYLEGQNVEIMANSDNVLRGGLTPKHIDVPELMKHVAFKPTVPEVIDGRQENGFETVFETPAPDFELSRILIPSGKAYTLHISTADIFLVLKGKVKAGDEVIGRGEAFLAVNGTALDLTAESDAEIYRATTP